MHTIDFESERNSVMLIHLNPKILLAEFGQIKKTHQYCGQRLGAEIMLNVRMDRIQAHVLICKSSFLRKVLDKWDKDLLILIRLSHYKSGYRTRGEFTHTIAVAKVTKQLHLIFYKGRVNHLYQSKY